MLILVFESARFTKLRQIPNATMNLNIMEN